MTDSVLAGATMDLSGMNAGIFISRTPAAGMLIKGLVFHLFKISFPSVVNWKPSIRYRLLMRSVLELPASFSHWKTAVISLVCMLLSAGKGITGSNCWRIALARLEAFPNSFARALVGFVCLTRSGTAREQYFPFLL